MKSIVNIITIVLVILGVFCFVTLGLRARNTIRLVISGSGMMGLIH